MDKKYPQGNSQFKFSEFGQPGCPKGPLKVYNLRKTGCTVQWQQSEYDGGTRITKYSLETMNLSDDNPKWEIVTDVWRDATDLSAPVKLTKFQKYRFRVTAIDADGRRSEPLETTEATLACDPSDSPDFCGQPHEVQREDTCEDDGDLEREKYEYRSVNKVAQPEVEPSKELAKLSLDSQVNAAQRADATKYTTKVSNEYVADEARMRVLVLDKPEGPLEISEVTPSSCILRFKPSPDTGVTEKIEYVVERREDSSHKWVKMKLRLGNMSQTFIKVNFHKQHQSLQFRVSAKNIIGISSPLYSETITTTPFAVAGGPSGFEIKDINEKLEARPAGVELRLVTQSSCFVRSTDTTVDGLDPGEKNKFYVIDKNGKALSQPSQATRPVELNPKFKAAGSLGVLEVVDVNKNSLELQCPKLKNDGGARIQDYRVEQRTANSDWEPSKISPDGAPGELAYGTSATVQDLQTDGEFMFRVVPVNAVGSGEASQPSRIVQVNEKAVPPRAPDGLDNIARKLGKQYMQLNDDNVIITKLPFGLEEGTLTQSRVKGLFGTSPGAPDIPALLTTIAPKEPVISMHDVNVRSSVQAELGNHVKTKRFEQDTVDVHENSTNPFDIGANHITFENPSRREFTINTLNISGLDENIQSQIQVCGQNAIGFGEPNAPTPVTTIAPTPAAPKVLNVSVRDVNVHTGQKSEITVLYSGFPSPIVVLERNGEPVKTGDNVKIRVEDDDILIHNKRAKQSDTGSYRIILKNSSGEDSTSFNVNVFFRCSGCLVEAFELKDEAILRRMLFDRKVDYSDTHWMPISDRLLRNKLSLFAKYSNQSSYIVYAKPRVGRDGCHHPSATKDKTLIAGEETNSVAISVVLMAMLLSTPNFNLLKILIESGKFDFREGLVFHLCDSFSKEWKLIEVNPLGMALLIDIHGFMEEDRHFLLTRTLLDSKAVSLDDKFSVYEKNNSNVKSFRTKGPIAFLFKCAYNYFSFNPTNIDSSHMLLLFKMLCRYGFEVRSPLRIEESVNCESQQDSTTILHTLAVLFTLFDNTSRKWKASTEYYISELINMGLIFPECENNFLFCKLNYYLHSESEETAASVKRVCRQLFALGLFRQPVSITTIDPQLPWAQRCLYDGATEILCEICRTGHLLIDNEECPVVAPLVREFLSGPLTLLQLTRIEIRSLIGVRESRIETLKEELPPIVFRYIKRADEMLAEKLSPR